MAQRGSNNKVANSLVAVSSAAVLAVYAAGYARTEPAAKLLETRTAERRPAPPQQPQSSPPPADPRRMAANSAPVPPPPAAAGLKREAPREPRLIASAEPSLPPVAVAPVAPAPEAAPVPGPAPTPLAAPVIAPAPPEPKTDSPAPAPAPAAHVWKDGTYTGWGTSRHGDIQATVVIEGGHIASAKIAQCLTRYSCDVIDKLPPQVAQRQSPEVDYVSGATQSTNAFYYAVVEALDKAK